MKKYCSKWRVKLSFLLLLSSQLKFLGYLGDHWTFIFLPMEWRIWRLCKLRLLIYLQVSVLHCLRISVSKNLRIFHFVWRQESIMYVREKFTSEVWNGTFIFFEKQPLFSIFGQQCHIWKGQAGQTKWRTCSMECKWVWITQKRRYRLWSAFIFET